MAAVGVVFGSKCLPESFFFHGDFAAVGDGHQGNGDEGVVLGGHDRGSDIHSKHSRVDGMAYETIGARAHQLMLGLDGDFTAPIAAEVAARPECQQKEGHLQSETDWDEERRIGEEVAGQSWHGNKEQEE